MKKFRIVNIDRGKYYRIDQHHSLLFGLICWWDKGAYDLCPYVHYPTFENALKALICKYGDGNFKWYVKHETMDGEKFKRGDIVRMARTVVIDYAVFEKGTVGKVVGVDDDCDFACFVSMTNAEDGKEQQFFCCNNNLELVSRKANVLQSILRRIGLEDYFANSKPQKLWLDEMKGKGV